MENKHIAVGAAALAVLILAASCAAMDDEVPAHCRGAGQGAGLSDTVVPAGAVRPVPPAPPRVAPAAPRVAAPRPAAPAPRPARPVQPVAPAVPVKPAAPAVNGTPRTSLSKAPAVTKAPAASSSPHRGTGGSHGGGFHIDLDLDGDGC